MAAVWGRQSQQLTGNDFAFASSSSSSNLSATLLLCQDGDRPCRWLAKLDMAKLDGRGWAGGVVLLVK